MPHYGSDTASLHSRAYVNASIPAIPPLPYYAETLTPPISEPSSPDLRENRPRLSSDASSVMNHLMRTTAANAIQLDRDLKNARQPLNVMTTMPKNMHRFTMRVGPIVWLQDTAVEVLTWQTPLKSVLAILSWILLCKSHLSLCIPYLKLTNRSGLYPLLLAILPQIILISVAFYRYYRKTKHLAMNKSKYGQNIQYLKNLQFIQNFIGHCANFYDVIQGYLQKLDWEDEHETWMIVKWIFYSIFGTGIVVMLAPLQYLAMVGGLVAFMANAPFFKAATTVLPPVVMSSVKEKMETLRERVQSSASSILERDTSESTLNASESEMVTLFENQRWWSGGCLYSSLMSFRKFLPTDKLSL